MILAVVLSLAILLGWNFYEQSRLEEIAANAPAETTQTATTNGEVTPSADGAALDTPVAASDEISIEGFASEMSRNDILAQVPRLKIETPRLSGSISLKGAALDDLILKDYQVTQDADSENVVLFEPVGSKDAYYTIHLWFLPRGVEGPGRDTVWRADRDLLTPENPVTLSWENGAGLLFEQVISIDADYMFTIEQKLTNNSDAPIATKTFGIINRSHTPVTTDFYILHEGPYGVFNEVLQEVAYDDLQEEGTIKETTTGGWLGLTDKYWMSALIPDQKTEVSTGFKATPANGDYRYQVDYLGPQADIATGDTYSVTSRVFAGAKQTTLIDDYMTDLGIVEFDQAIDFGIFYWLTKPIFYAIHWLYGVVGNFGVAILILTLAIKLVLFPLANKSYVSMSRMKLLQPKVQALKERHGDDRQKMQQEMMALYKKEKVNPMAGCLPILVQIPIFFALYKVLFMTIEMRHAPFFGWIQDLSAPDPLTLLPGFCMIEWEVPAMLAMLNIGIWPIIMGVTMFLQQKLNPAPADPVQAKIFTFMPIFFTFLLGTFPAGLVIYWAWNNTLSILQQWVIMKRMGVAIGGGKAE
ncbi:MAG: membrane protein insertase YidC [Alphaproteobacteria bacterium]|nr:membrane protein insertase YidC [Alphaproteobacteria bacterium]